VPMERVLICGLEGGAGASVVALALARLLAPLGRRPVYFKPVGDGDGDPDVALFARDDEAPAAAQAVSRREAAALVAAGRSEELLARIAAAADARAAGGAFLLAEGINDERDAFGVKLNEQIALRLDAPVLLVAKAGHLARPEEVSDLVAACCTAVQLYREAGVAVLGVVVNRAHASALRPGPRFESFEALARALGAAFAATEVRLLGVLPERPLLAAPKLAAIAQALDAEVVAADGALEAAVLHVVVADMEPRHLLAALRHEATLVVTSGDRESVLLALACVQASKRRSGLAGVVLTGGHLPDDAVLALIREIEITRLPVLAVRTDAFETATRLRELRVRLGPGDRERAGRAAEALAQTLDRGALLAALAVAPPPRRPAPRGGPAGFLAQLLARAREARAHIVLPEGDEPRTLRALATVLAEKLARVTLLGDAEAIAKRAAELGVVLDGAVAIVDPRLSPELERYAAVVVEARQHKRGGVTLEAAREWLLESTIQFGTAMVAAGDADGLVSGAAHSTADTVRPALQVIGVRPDVGLASSIFFMALPDRVLVYGDCAIVPDPNARELAAIAVAAARTARAFGLEPRVALLSYSTGASGAGLSVDKVGEAMALLRERDLDFPVDGPMQYDAAVDEEVARQKLPGSPVAGRANVLVFPDLDAGNIAYKAVQRATGSLAIGPILQGLNRPVNDLSRGCSVEDVVYTIAATAIQARAGA